MYDGGTVSKRLVASFSSQLLTAARAGKLLAWLAVDQMALGAGDLRVGQGELVKALLGLVELLLLQLGKVHRHVTTKGHGHGLDDVYQRQFGAIGNRGFLCALDHWVALFGQVDSDQNMFVGHEAFLQGTAISSVWLLSSGWGCRRSNPLI